jgi:hypothetical protein
VKLVEFFFYKKEEESRLSESLEGEGELEMIGNLLKSILLICSRQFLLFWRHLHLVKSAEIVPAKFANLFWKSRMTYFFQLREED